MSLLSPSLSLSSAEFKVVSFCSCLIDPISNNYHSAFPVPFHFFFFFFCTLFFSFFCFFLISYESIILNPYNFSLVLQSMSVMFSVSIKIFICCSKYSVFYITSFIDYLCIYVCGGGWWWGWGCDWVCV